jgi:hypothetical protein
MDLNRDEFQITRIGPGESFKLLPDLTDLDCQPGMKSVYYDLERSSRGIGFAF